MLSYRNPLKNLFLKIMFCSKLCAIKSHRVKIMNRDTLSSNNNNKLLNKSVGKSIKARLCIFTLKNNLFFKLLN